MKAILAFASMVLSVAAVVAAQQKEMLVIDGQHQRLIPRYRSTVPMVESANEIRFPSSTEAVRIPFEGDDGHISVLLRINGSDPLRFALDTGATHTIINRKLETALHLRPEGKHQIEGAGGYEQASLIKNVSIKLGDVELVNQTLWSLPLDALAQGSGREIAGIIGYDLFRHFVVDIDFVARQIALYDPKTFKYAGSGQSIPLLVQADGAIYVEASIAVASHNPIEGQFVIDTGSNNTLMLARPFVEQHRLLESVGLAASGRGSGVGGEIQFAFGRVKSLQIGPFAIANPLTAFITVGEIADSGKSGNIGGRLLRRFRVIFDYSGQRMLLEPNKFFSEPDESDMSGLGLIAEPPDFKTIRVIKVRPNSPAAEAGLMPQDVITAVDGERAPELAKLRLLFRQDGKEHLLTIRRGDQAMQIKIKLRRLI